MLRKTISTDLEHSFQHQIGEAVKDGWRVVPGTMFAGSRERAATDITERRQQSEGCRFFKSFFFVEMVKGGE